MAAAPRSTDWPIESSWKTELISHSGGGDADADAENNRAVVVLFDCLVSLGGGGGHFKMNWTDKRRKTRAKNTCRPDNKTIALALSIAASWPARARNKRIKHDCKTQKKPPLPLGADRSLATQAPREDDLRQTESEFSPRANKSPG